MTKEKAIPDDFPESLDEAEWSWIRPHAQRNGLIFVTQNLQLKEVERAIASDATHLIKEWIENQLILKPSLEQMQEWDQAPTQKFKFAIVQPYVLIQELIYH